MTTASFQVSDRLEQQAEPTSDERTFALLAHLGGLVAGFIPALIIWLVKRDESRFVGEQAREALNFQISVILYMLLCLPLVFFLIGIPLMFAVAALNLVGCILAAVRANEGEQYRYPLCIRFV